MLIDLTGGHRDWTGGHKDLTGGHRDLTGCPQPVATILTLFDHDCLVDQINLSKPELRRKLV